MIPKILKYKGATYVRVATEVSKEAIEQGWKKLGPAFNEVFEAKMDLYYSLKIMEEDIKEMGYTDIADKVDSIKMVVAKSVGFELREIQHQLEDRIGKDLGSKVVINW